MKNPQLIGDLAALEIGLLREDFDWVLGEAQRLRNSFPEAKDDAVLNYYTGQAIFRKEMHAMPQDMPKHAKLCAADEYLNRAIKSKPDFAEAHFFRGYVQMVIARSSNNRSSCFSALYHLVKAKELNPVLSRELDSKISILMKDLDNACEVVLCSTKQDMVLEWMIAFEEYPWVKVLHEDIMCQMKYDAVVSPANSFGFMDGGLDYQLRAVFGADLEKRLQEIIKREHCGELIVGQAVILETGHQQVPYLVSAPTMRVPMQIKDTLNPYLATRAALLAIKGFNKNGTKIKSVVFPGMGTGIGEVPYGAAARQMKAAYDAVVLERVHFPKDFAEAQQRHRGLAMEHFHKLYRGEY